jgi:NADPH-dependent glutamate synthase beta subunit-like oxidoreductase/formate hydrogenlyase subunit 6/NADH:ubiquinone oxidoreductase subunit I
MPRITIDRRAVEVTDGTTVLTAAGQLGIHIPTICFGGNGCGPSASCLVCAVKLLRTGQMIPSCAVQVADGMEIESQTGEVEEVRRAAVELLLSDHVGDCISLCSQSCPAHTDIPAMLRQVRAGRFADAAAIAKRHLALPATLGRVCHRPCQRPCRRKTFDAPVAIGAIERCVADQDLASAAPCLPDKAESTGRRVAIVGGGPTGLSAAWHLLLQGHDCTVFDERDVAGGSLFDEFPAEVLPREVVAAEVASIRRLGAGFELGGPRVDAARLEELLAGFDAVLCAVGRVRSDEVAQLGLAAGLHGIGVNRFLQASRQRVFAAGQATRRTGRRVHSVAAGRMAAIYLGQFLAGSPLIRQVQPFSSHVKCLRPDEMPQFMAVADPTPPGPASNAAERVGLTCEEAVREAGRCCRCDCRKADSCRLRQAAAQLGARRNRYAAPRRAVDVRTDHNLVIYEPGKCIRCGNCLRVAEKAGEPLGLAFVGRGFNVQVTAPLDDALSAALQRAARECVEACPTAALSLKSESDLAEAGAASRRGPDLVERPGPQDHVAAEQPARTWPGEDLDAAREASAPTRDVQWIEPVIPCQSACPAHTRIPEYLAAVARGAFDAAYKINLQDNVFSAVLGRVCARPCEAACRHGRPAHGEPLAICFSKRAAADFFAGDPVTLAPLFDRPTGKRVAIVGAGVAGLTVARELARCGHAVTVLEKHSRPGGMLNQGIPAFRLPRDVVDREIEQVRRCGVEIRTGVEVGKDLLLTDLLAGHDAVVLAGGTLRRNRLDLPGGDLAGIRHGLDFLLDVNEQRLSALSGATIVIGGGFTAMDCARAAKRLSSGAVTVCYRRSRHEMLVTPGELEELEREGIPLEEMLAPTGYERDGKGHVCGVRFVRTALGEPDASGRRRPVPIPGSECVWPADNVILATGQFPDTSWIDGQLRGQLVGDDGWLKTGRAVRTAHEKLFAAGDFAQGAMSLIDAIGHAKRCAREIDTFLCGTERWGELAMVEQAAGTGREPGPEQTVRQAMPARPVAQRRLTTEVETGFSAEAACTEATRCYLCCYLLDLDANQCIHCGACLEVKSAESCILPMWGPSRRKAAGLAEPTVAEFFQERALLAINQDECIRCGACADVCPVQCIRIRRITRLAAPIAPLPLAKTPSGNGRSRPDAH